MNKTEFQDFLWCVQMPIRDWFLLTVFTHFTFFHQQVSTGHIIIPSSLLWLQSEFLLMTAVGLLCSGSAPALSTFHWWTRTAICLNKLIPAVRLNLWKTHHCDNFRHVWLFKWIFRDVPSCNLCYLSQIKNRIKLTCVSTPLKRWHLVHVWVFSSKTSNIEFSRKLSRDEWQSNSGFECITNDTIINNFPIRWNRRCCFWRLFF